MWKIKVKHDLQILDSLVMLSREPEEIEDRRVGSYMIDRQLMYRGQVCRTSLKSFCYISGNVLRHFSKLTLK